MQLAGELSKRDRQVAKLQKSMDDMARKVSQCDLEVKHCKSSTENQALQIKQFEKTLEETVINIGDTINCITEELQDRLASSAGTTEAQWSLHPPPDPRVHQMVDTWLHQQTSEVCLTLEPELAQEEEISQVDEWGVDWSLCGNHEEYEVRPFEFKCLEGKDPNTWPLPFLDEGSIIPSESDSGSFCNV